MTRTIVVGAGIIGLACAYALRKRGREVLVIDQAQPGAACSSGNAGWIVPSLSGPLPGPGLTRTSLQYILRRDSPLYIAPRAAPGLARWLWRFWRCCNRRDFRRGLDAVANLNRRTLSQFDQLERDGLSFELHRDGLLFVFLDPGHMRATLADFEHYRSFGYEDPRPLDGSALRELEPVLSDEVNSGFLVPNEYHVRPETLTAAYLAGLGSLQVPIQTGVAVLGPAGRSGRSALLETSAGPIAGDEILITAGAWSGRLAERFGIRLPVQAGKGYSITLDGNAPPITRPLYLGEARVGCSPFQGAVRFAGTMELSGINTVLDRRRVVGMRKGIARYLRTPVAPDDGIEWVGMRPLTPDGLPLLGRLPGFENHYIATGHAMLGVTLAPATAEAMAELMTGIGPAPELAAFDPGRFRW